MDLPDESGSWKEHGVGYVTDSWSHANVMTDTCGVRRYYNDGKRRFWSNVSNVETNDDVAKTWWGSYRIIDIQRGQTGSNVVNYNVDGTLDSDSITTNILNISRYVAVWAQESITGVVTVDWFLVRNYVSPEPADGAWGSEESPPHSSYKTKVGDATTWAWKIVYSTDAVNTVPSGTPTDWTWRTWTPNSGRKVPQGTAADWTWGPE